MQQLPLPPLAEGETYIGAIGDSAGNLHHVILLPGWAWIQYFYDGYQNDYRKGLGLRARAVRRLPIE